MTTTWGLDMSTSKAKTAAVAIEWHAEGAQVVRVRHPLAAADIAGLIAQNRHCRWAVDVPFGWPDRFVALMGTRHDRPLPIEEMPVDDDWEVWRTQRIAQRRTDALLTTDPQIRTRPLPASFQLLGATAAMWVLIEARLVSLGVHVDRAGIDGTVCETYPRAALAGWGSPAQTKRDWNALRQVFPYLAADSGLLSTLESDDVCDAVVCALVARARDLNLTVVPRNADELAAARREGWIHVTVSPPACLLKRSNSYGPTSLRPTRNSK